MTPVRLRLREWREQRGLTQAALAERVGIRQATVSDLERGESARLDFALLERLCEALDIEPGELFEVEPARKRSRR
jgi:putative transcriptional regulator